MPIKKKEELLELARERRLRRALIVTALPLETRAVLAHVQHLGSVLGRSGIIYECGQASVTGEEWFIVVAESGAGTHPAQGVVTNGHIDFDAFDLVLFVGIAGSRKKKDAPIGSVVASSLVYYAHSGKWEAEVDFAYRPRSIQIKSRLVSVARWVERERNWFARIIAPLHGELPGDGQYPQPFPPAALVAPIISVEAVSADPNSHLEKQIALHNNDAVAVEMEGYGAGYAAYEEETGFIVIRGISDCREAKTPEADAINQPVAAAHAAAYAFELLNVWSQFYPTEPSPPVSSETATTQADGISKALPAAQQARAAVPRIFVLNFDGSAADFPPDKVERIVQRLKEISGSPSFEVIRTEEGSFRMLIRASREDIEKIDTPETYHALRQDYAVRLLGIYDETEYKQIPQLASSLERASRDLLAWPRNLPDGTHFPRPELDQLLSIIGSAESTTMALLGPPGSGKSALLASLAQELRKQRVPFLAIKADLLDDEIRTEDDLTAYLQLPSLVSSVLLQLSRSRPTVLLIDQLDALAGYVDLRTGRLNALLNLVRKLGERRNIHIVLSARTFEFEHDTRLKAVRAESIALALPPWSAVLKVLESYGILAAGWPPDAQEFMRAPQALSTFLKLKHKAHESPFLTYQAVLDQLWNEQILAKPNGARLAALVGEIAETMAEKEVLWLAAAKFEDQIEDINALVASGILTDYEETGSRIGFSHQTVFDHALARSFAKGNLQLSAYTLDRQASLFVRPKLWSALTYLRGVEPSSYHEELRTIWAGRDLRVHLRHLLVEFMGQQPAPTQEEAAIYEQALSSPVRATALQAMVGSPGWLSRFASSHVASAMTTPGEAHLAANILDKAWSIDAEAVQNLIRKYWLPKTEFDGRVWSVLENCPSWGSETISIAKTVMNRTEIAPFAFDYLVSTLGVEQPELALDLISTRLHAQLRVAIAEAERRAAVEPPAEQKMLWYMSNSPSGPLTDMLEQRNEWEGLDELARTHPALFLHYIWPWFYEAQLALCRIRDEDESPGFPVSHRVDFRFAEESSMGLAEPAILGALTTAVESFAAQDGDAFLNWLASHEDEHFSPAQRLFAHGLASVPERYASRALAFLLGNEKRFYLGNFEDHSGTTKRLIRSASPYWSDEALEAFAEAVRKHSPAVPGHLEARARRSFSNILRRTKLGLLLCLPQDRLPAKVEELIRVESRRFPDEKVGATITGPEWVGSPIPARSLALASDDDIVNAFRELPDASGWDHPKHWGRGGNIQLSREFAEFAKGDPERAARLIGKFEPSFGTRAAGYALDALSENADPSLVFQLVHELDQRGFKGEEFRGSVARGIQRLLRREIAVDDRTLQILTSWLGKQDVGSEGEPAEAETDDGSDHDDNREKGKKKEERHGSVLWGHSGISVLPHGNYPILEAISRIYLDRKRPDELVELYAKHLQFDEDPEVWEALLRYFRYIHPANLKPFEDFIAALLRRYPDLENTPDAAVMLASMLWKFPDLILGVLSRWKQSDDRWLQQTYGELVGLMALLRPELARPRVLLEELVSSDQMRNARTGTAYSAVNLWSDPKITDSASKLLREIIPKADAVTWGAILDLFRLVDEIVPDAAWISLLEVMAENIGNAKGVSSSFMVERLQTLLPHHAMLVSRLANGLVANWRDDLGDMRTGTSAQASELVDIAITLHRLGSETREAGTKLFEELLVINAYTARETLNEIDNRFRNASGPVRRRLPRRRVRNLKTTPRARRAAS